MPKPPQLATLRFAGAGQSWRILVKAAQVIDGEQQRMLNATVATFCLAARMGAFCSSASPAAVRATVKSVYFTDNDADFEVDFEGVDHQSFQVLRQMFSGLQTEGLGVTGITIAGPGLDQYQAQLPSVAGFDSDEESVYPRLIPGVPLTRDASQGFAIGSRLRRCEITIDERVTTGHIEALRELAAPWFTMLACGGYALPVEMPWVVNNVGGEINLFDVCSLELTVFKFESSEQAWVSLANMIRLAGPSLGLRALEIRVDD